MPALLFGLCAAISSLLTLRDVRVVLLCLAPVYNNCASDLLVRARVGSDTEVGKRRQRSDRTLFLQVR